jgi:uncharacterized protein with beta-barrel porin domain
MNESSVIINKLVVYIILSGCLTVGLGSAKANAGSNCTSVYLTHSEEIQNTGNSDSQVCTTIESFDEVVIGTLSNNNYYGDITFLENGAGSAKLEIKNDKYVAGDIKSYLEDMGHVIYFNGEHKLSGNIGDAQNNIMNLVIKEGGSLVLSKDSSIYTVKYKFGARDAAATIDSKIYRLTLGGTEFNHNEAFDFSGDTLKFTIAKNSQNEVVNGNIKASYGITTNSNTTINVSTLGYIANETTGTLIDTDSQNNNIVAGTKIIFNNIARNSNQIKAGLLTFETNIPTSGNALKSDATYIITRDKAESVTTNKYAQNIFTAINNGNINTTKGELQTIQSYLDSADTTTSQREAALMSVSPQLSINIHQTARDIASNIIRVAENRLDLSHGNLGLASGGKYLNQNSWVQAFGTISNQNNEQGFTGYKLNSGGIAVGSDKEVADNAIVGLSLNYADSNIKSNDGLKKTNIDTYQVNIYGDKEYGSYFIDGIAGFAWNKYNSERSIPIATSNIIAKYNGQTYLAAARVGSIQELGKGFNLVPELRLSYIHNRIEGYKEKNAKTVNLYVDSNRHNLLQGTVGASLEYKGKIAKLIINPKLRVAYGYDFIADNNSTVSRFIGRTDSFTSPAYSSDRNRIIAGATIDIYQINEMTLTANYNFEHKSRYNSNSASIKVRYLF